MAIRKISLQEAEYIGHRYVIEFMSTSEPIPPFSTRYPGRLESCLELPFQTYGGKHPYYFFVQKAAMLFYLIIKNHPFSNGNKRMAVVLTLVFFYKNKYWLNVSQQDLYELACSVAKSKSEDKDKVVAILTKFFKDNKTILKKIKKTSIGGRSKP